MTREILRREVIAHNDARDSGNPLHDDDGARAMGFKAALVPGVTVYGYLTHDVIRHFGERWLEEGCMRVRFRQPLFAGDRLSLETHAERRESIEVNALNPEREVCVTAVASMRPGASQVLLSPHWQTMSTAPERGQLPEPKWAAERNEFQPGRLLGSINAPFAACDAEPFAAAMQDDHPIYQQAVHPAWLLRQANLIVDRNFAVGAWIHTDSEVQNLGLAPYDENVETRARVLAQFEKKGHHYADLDVVLLANGDPQRPVMRVVHRAIYQPATAA